MAVRGAVRGANKRVRVFQKSTGERTSTRPSIEVIGAILVVVAVTVAPGPVFLLFSGRQLAEVSMFVAMIFSRPRLVIDHFVVIPDVIVGVIGVIDPVVMMCAGGAQHGTCQRGRKKTGSQETRLDAHL